MTTVFFNSDLDDPQAWQATLQAAIPDLRFIIGPDCPQPAEVDIALLWTPPAQGYGPFSRLKAVLSLGAGVDQLRLEGLPAHIPVARLIDPTLTRRMVEYCLTATLYFHRDLHLHARHQRARQWRFIAPRSAAERRVLVLGLGELGSAVAQALAQQGFQVSGWSRSPKQLAGVTCLHGDDTLASALPHCDILINLLPLTAQTRGLLDRRCFERLQAGTCLVQVGRGGHLVEPDLLAALERGQIGGAFLDVFATEPLPPEHPFWAHPDLVVTPHVASISDPARSAAAIVDNIHRVQRGEPLHNTIDRATGY